MNKMVGRWCLRTSEAHKNTCKPELKQLQAIYDNGFETMSLKYFTRPPIQKNVCAPEIRNSFWSVKRFSYYKYIYRRYRYWLKYDKLFMEK